MQLVIRETEYRTFSSSCMNIDNNLMNIFELFYRNQDPHSGGGWWLHADQKYVDTRLVGTRKLVTESPQSPPCCCCQLLSHVQLFATPWTAAGQASLSFPISWSLLKLMSIESKMLPNHLILCCPLLLLPSVFPSIRIFSNELALHIRSPKYRSFSFSISPSNEYSTLISFRIDWFDLLVIQGTLKGLLQHHNSKASIQYSTFFMVQLSHSCMTTEKTIALTIQTFVGKVICLGLYAV